MVLVVFTCFMKDSFLRYFQVVFLELLCVIVSGSFSVVCMSVFIWYFGSFKADLGRFLGSLVIRWFSSYYLSNLYVVFF
jgi:hypothetical protein